MKDKRIEELKKFHNKLTTVCYKSIRQDYGNYAITVFINKKN